MNAPVKQLAIWRLLCVAAAFSFALCRPGLSEELEEPDRQDLGVRLKVGLDRDVYDAGEPILLAISIENAAAAPVSCRCGFRESLNGGTTLIAFHDVFGARLRGPHGAIRNWYPRLRVYLGASILIGSGDVILAPGERHTHHEILTRSLRDLAPGNYSLDWSLGMPCFVGGTPHQPGPLRWLVGAGTLEFRIQAGNRKHLEETADEWLKTARRSYAEARLALNALATMPPDIALPRIAAYLGPVRRFSYPLDIDEQVKAGRHLNYEAGLLSLIFVESPAAVDLLARIRDAQEGPAPEDEAGSPASHVVLVARDALIDMYLTTERPDVEKAILRVQPFPGSYLHKGYNERRRTGYQELFQGRGRP